MHSKVNCSDQDILNYFLELLYINHETQGVGNLGSEGKARIWERHIRISIHSYIILTLKLGCRYVGVYLVSIFVSYIYAHLYFCMYKIFSNKKFKIIMQNKKDKLTFVIRKKLIEREEINQNSIKVINVLDVQKSGMERKFSRNKKLNPLIEKKNIVVIGKLYAVIATWKYILFKILDLKRKK